MPPTATSCWRSNARSSDAYSALATTIQLAVDRGAVRPLVRTRTPVPGWNQLPTDESLATNDTGRALMAIRGIPQSIGRAFAVRPGTPADRVAMLRDAIAKTVQDPAFIEEAKKAKIHTEYISADTVTKSFGELLNQPPPVLEAIDANKFIWLGSSGADRIDVRDPRIAAVQDLPGDARLRKGVRRRDDRPGIERP